MILKMTCVFNTVLIAFSVKSAWFAKERMRPQVWFSGKDQASVFM